jgi:lipopolysaccharide transport system permease protein
VALSPTINTAESQVSQLKDVFRAMIHGLRTCHYAAIRLVTKEIKADYANSKFGVAWDILDPLVLGGIFWFLMHSGVISTGFTRLPHSVFVIYGLFLYQTFADSVAMMTSVIRRSRGLLNQLKISPEALIFSVIYRVLFNSSFRIAIMLLFSLLSGAISLPGFLKFLVAYPSLILAGISFGILLAPFQAIYRDIGKVVNITLNVMRYGSPVLFAYTNNPPFNVLNAINPIALILSNLRLVATTNEFPDAAGFGLRLIFFMILILPGWFIFHVSIPVLADRS